MNDCRPYEDLPLTKALTSTTLNFSRHNGTAICACRPLFEAFVVKMMVTRSQVRQKFTISGWGIYVELGALNSCRVLHFQYLQRLEEYLGLMASR